MDVADTQELKMRYILAVALEERQALMLQESIPRTDEKLKIVGVWEPKEALDFLHAKYARIAKVYWEFFPVTLAAASKQLEQEEILLAKWREAQTKKAA